MSAECGELSTMISQGTCSQLLHKLLPIQALHKTEAQRNHCLEGGSKICKSNSETGLLCVSYESQSDKFQSKRRVKNLSMFSTERKLFFFYKNISSACKEKKDYKNNNCRFQLGKATAITAAHGAYLNFTSKC